MNQPNSSLPSVREVAARAVEVLRQGGIILYPTDTIWGLGCDATNAEAVARLSELKGRPSGKPMLMLVDSEARLPAYVRNVPSAAYDLIDVAVRPLTIIYPEGRNVAAGLIGEDGCIGIRIAADELCREICRGLRKPLVSTSANPAGMPNPRGYADIDASLIEAADYVVPLRREEYLDGIPSDIIKVGPTNEVTILRG